MVISGRVENGVVVMEDNMVLPEGAEVSVFYPPAELVPSKTGMRQAPTAGRPVQLPLVPSKAPGTRRLTADKVAEILDQEDVSAGR